MNLPFRIQSQAGTTPVISIDGAFGAPGLHLSHWPGNTTPPELRHELSTGIALNFARLAPEEQARLVEGCTAIANNHYDTDGACSLFALLQPEKALAREAALLDVASAGDFFRLPSEAAFQIDVVLGALADPERSPLHLEGLDDGARYERAYAEALRLLPELLDGSLEPFAELWNAPLERLRADLASLSAASLDDLVHLDLALWTGSTGGTFDPGRHALFGSTEADRVLAVGTGAEGNTYRMILGTRSWFDLPEEAVLPPARPDLAELARTLNELEGSSPADGLAWRAQSMESASPELWFGSADHPMFAEHGEEVLSSSRLTREVVKARVVDALRATWVFPDEDDEGDWMDV